MLLNFSDARRGYWNIKPTRESSLLTVDCLLLTTFNSPFVTYGFFVCFSVCASDIYQSKADNTCDDLPCVTRIANDIVVYGHTLVPSSH